MSKETIEKAEKVVENFVRKKVNETAGKVGEYMYGKKPQDEEELDEAVFEANSWIDWTARDDDELYKQFRFRKFKGPSGTYLAQGREDKDVDPRK